ncbi:MAG: HlyD family efflux transporter periplasmic adaptor subunit [Myxococcota bacterium]|nr:HlyD family efflux transporter periplasmic adaptor subunit [Myxococcota bacterium]
MKRFLKSIIKGLLFFALIGVGILAYRMLAQAKETPPRDDETKNATVVEVSPALPSDQQVKIHAMGNVMPARTVTLSPEISGKITYCNKKLVPGGRFRAGETVLKVDPKQYELYLKQQRAAVARAEMELSMEQGRKAVAEQEWQLMEDDIRPTEEAKRLALRDIHLETAKATLASAQSSMAIAEMNRKRTVISAPFNALVTEKYVDMGQVVGPGVRLATLVDADTFWVGVSVPVHKLPWIKIPRGKKKNGSTALVTQEIGDGVNSIYQGRVVKLLSGVDPRGKMAQLLVEVENPLEPMATSADIHSSQRGDGEGDGDLSFPLLLDAAVTVEIHGPMLAGTLEIPRHAVRKDDTVWVLTQDRKLSIREVQVLWTTVDKAYVRGDIAPQENAITSRLDTPIAGMALRLEGEKVAADGGTDTEPDETTAVAKENTPEGEQAR